MKIKRAFDGVVGTVTNLTTTTAPKATIDTVPIPLDKTVKITVDVAAKRDDLTEKGGFEKEALFANNSGTVSQQGGTMTLFHEAQADWNVTFLILGTDVLVQVETGAAIPVDWDCLRNVREV